MNRRAKVFCFLFIGLSSLCVGAPWVRSYGGRGYNALNCIRATTDRGYVAVGISSSFGGSSCSLWVLKIDASAEILWQTAFEGYGIALVDSGCCIQQTADGGYVIASTYGLSAGSGDFWVIKLDPNGNSEWQYTYGGAQEDLAYAILQTRDGGYIVAGITDSFGAGGSDMWILKLDPVGRVTWQKTYGDKGEDWARSIVQTKDGGYLVAGDHSGSGCLLKLGAQGVIQWQKGFGGLGIREIKELPSGEFVGTGMSHETDGTAGFLAFKMSAKGNVQWQRIYGGKGADLAYSICQTRDGGFVVVGETASFGARETDIWVIKLGSDGTKSWERAYRGTKADDARSVVQGTDGTIIVAGNTQSFGLGDASGLILALTPGGEEDEACNLSRSTTSKKGPDLESFVTNLEAGETDITPQSSYLMQKQPYGPAYDFCRGGNILSIQSEEGGTTDPKPGDYVYSANSEVTIKATAKANYTFSGWSGDASGTANPLTLTMDSHKYIMAHFYQNADWGGDGGGGGGWGSGPMCFIATSAYGSSSHPKVKILREFRDRYLLNNRPGRRLIAFYYRVSPDLASIVARHRFLRVMAKLALLPVVGVSYLVLKLGTALSSAGLAVGIALAPFLAHRLRKKRKSHFK